MGAPMDSWEKYEILAQRAARAVRTRDISEMEIIVIQLGQMVDPTCADFEENYEEEEDEG